MPANQADYLLNLWATTLLKHGESPPFADHQDLYTTIDSIPLGGVKWQGFSCTYSGDEKLDGSYPPWMDESYDVWYRDPCKVVRNMLAHPAYSDEMDYRLIVNILLMEMSASFGISCLLIGLGNRQ